MEPPRGEASAAGATTGGGVVRACRVDAVSLRSFLCTHTRPRLAWADATTTIAAGGAAAVLTAEGEMRFRDIREQADRLYAGLESPDSVPAGARPRVFGGFSFTASRGEDRENGRWEGYPDAEFVLPAVQFSVTADGAWVTATAVGPDAHERATSRVQDWRDRSAALPELGVSEPPGVDAREYTPKRERWRADVGSVTGRIRDGELRKVVLAQALRAELDTTPVLPDVLARLGESYPGCHRFLFEPAHGGAFFGATPERLVSVSGDTVDTEALAGSAGRGETTAEDEWLASQLADSAKDGHEHDLVVEAIRNQLSPLVEAVETGTRTVRQLATVQHLRTPVRATLAGDRHVLELVEALHPTPAVGGMPPRAALETIQEAEAFDRGWYAAPVGWFDRDGDGTFAVAIRSAIARGTTATLFAGAGIVADSDADEEWDELQLKYRPVLDELA